MELGRETALLEAVEGLNLNHFQLNPYLTFLGVERNQTSFSNRDNSRAIISRKCFQAVNASLINLGPKK